MIACSYDAVMHDLPCFRFAHAVHSDVISTKVFQQLSSDKCEFDSIWKQTLLGRSQMSLQMEKRKSFQK